MSGMDLPQSIALFRDPACRNRGALRVHSATSFSALAEPFPVQAGRWCTLGVLEDAKGSPIDTTQPARQ